MSVIFAVMMTILCICATIVFTCLSFIVHNDAKSMNGASKIALNTVAVGLLTIATSIACGTIVKTLPYF